MNTPATGSSGQTPSGSLPIYTRNATGLVREIRLVDQLAYNIGAVTPLSSALILLFFAVAVFPRTNLYLALLIPAVAAIFCWVAWALLTATLPKVGGDYIFNTRILNPALGFGVNLGFVFSQALTAGFAAGFLPELALNPALLVIGTVTHNSTIASWASYFSITNGNGVFITSAIAIVFVCVLAGIRSSVLLRVMTVMVVIFGISATADILILLFTSNSDFINTFNSVAGSGAYEKVVAAGVGKGLYPSEGGYSVVNTIGTMFFGFGFSIWVFQGAYIAGEVRRAGQRGRMLFSYIGAGVIQTVFLLLALATFYHAVGENFAISAAAGNQTTGIATYPYYATLAAGNNFFSIILAIGFLFWSIPCMNVFMAIVQRGAFVYSFERLLPSWVARVNPRTHTPLVAVAIMGVLSLIGAAFDAYNGNFATALTLADVTALGAPFFVGIAALVMPWRRKDLFAGSPADWVRIGGIPIISIAGAGTVLLVGFFIVEPFVFASQVGLTAHSWLPWGTAILPVAIIVIGIIWWYVARAYHRGKGVNLDLLYKTIPPD